MTPVESSLRATKTHTEKILLESPFATPFVDLYSPGGNSVQFSGQRGQAAAGNTSLPQALDGNAIWMRVPQGNGSFTIDLGGANTGSVSTSVGEVTNPAALTGASYNITFATVAGTLQYTVSDPVTSLPLAGHTGVPYASGMTIEFDGQSLQLNGQPADGDLITVAPAGKTDIFSVVQDAVNALRDPSVAVRSQALERTMTELDAGHDRVLLARGRAGEWLNRGDSLDTLLEDRGVDLKAEKSRLEDLDLVQGISDFQTQQLGLEAALKSYAQVQRLSLFQVI